MAISQNKCIIVLVCWFNLYHVILEIKNNITFFDNRKCGWWFLTKIWPLSKVKPRYLEKKMNKSELNLIISKKMRGRILIIWFE